MHKPTLVTLFAFGCLVMEIPVFADETVQLDDFGQSLVNEKELASTRGLGGGADFLQWNDMELDANLTDNIVHSSTNGDNSISHGAFSEASGFATVIQNSGNHVIIQNATIVNMTME